MYDRLGSKAVIKLSRWYYTVMAGLVPAIRSGTLPRRMAGTSPAMTERNEWRWKVIGSGRWYYQSLIDMTAV